MKKFLLVVTLVGVVISQIFFSSQAAAYNEGDKLDVDKYICYNCNKIVYIIYLNGECIRDDLVQDGCPFWNGGEHFWMLYMGEEHKHYVYRNGQWVEVER